MSSISLIIGRGNDVRLLLDKLLKGKNNDYTLIYDHTMSLSNVIKQLEDAKNDIFVVCDKPPLYISPLIKSKLNYMYVSKDVSIQSIITMYHKYYDGNDDVDDLDNFIDAFKNMNDDFVIIDYVTSKLKGIDIEFADNQ